MIAVTGDGFYMYAPRTTALWAAAHYGAPFMVVVFQNRSYTHRDGATSERRTPSSYAERSGYDGGYFDPPIDFAKEAEAAGAYGENVRDPAEVVPALQRGRKANEAGKPAVISVWVEPLF